MKYKKFLLIPILIFLYIFFINFLVQLVVIVPEGPSTGEEQPSGGILQIGIGASASVGVTRPYFFGLLELPVYTDTLGDISPLNNTFFIFILVLIITFIIIEWRNRYG